MYYTQDKCYLTTSKKQDGQLSLRDGLQPRLPPFLPVLHGPFLHRGHIALRYRLD